jgi:hypothetical protein
MICLSIFFLKNFEPLFLEKYQHLCKALLAQSLRFIGFYHRLKNLHNLQSHSYSLIMESIDFTPKNHFVLNSHIYRMIHISVRAYKVLDATKITYSVSQNWHTNYLLPYRGCLNYFFVICLHFDSLIDILTNATSSSGMSL